MGECGRASPTVWLCYCLSCFPPEEQCPWYRCWDFTCGLSVFIAFQTHCALWIMAGGGHWVAVRPSDLFTQRLRPVWLAVALTGVTSPTHIGHVVVRGMCRNYMRLWPGSKLRQRRPHPTTRPHVCTKQEKRERQRRSMDDISCGPSCWTGLWMGAVIQKSR